jgi:hypothetical protein
MPKPLDPAALKRLLSPRVLAIPGVSGIGLPEGKLTVYLEVDDAKVRAAVDQVVAANAPEARPRYEVTGRFSK